ncbi:MAG: glycosyltransferase family 2 protein [Bacteroidetes bacterium]|nr:glycosyltransferase family 2 protein [Bacteroidota bacterium]MCL5737539.1 glycosyltransferase family 2 protein [Bacteroidota bacterium]
MKVLVVIPVYNEEKILAQSVTELHEYLTDKNLDFQWEIRIADNASKDKTLEVATQLSRRFNSVAVSHLDEKGRGRALKKVWTESDADIMAYMDVDLSTNLDSFLPMVNALKEEGYDIVIGSRLMRGANTTRSLKRETISRAYNLLVRLFFLSGFSDAQCGFKGVTRRVVREVLPFIENTNWFFDTELLIIAEKKGYKIKDVPVKWIEDLDTRVKIAKTAVEDIRGLIRVRLNFWKGVYR